MVRENESRVPDRVQHSIPDSVAVVGIGGVGSWLSLFLSEFEGMKRMGLFDSDVVEKSNLERTPFKRDQIGTNKAEAMKELIMERRPDIEVSCFDNLTEENEKILNLYKMKIASCDGVEPRNIVLRYKNGISSGYDITEECDHLSVGEEGPIWDVDGEGGYSIQPSWSVPAVLTAILTIYQIAQGERPINLSASVKEFLVRGVNDKLMFYPEPQDDSIAEEEKEDDNSRGLGELF